MNEHDNGLLYMLAFCLLLALVALLRSTPPPQRVAVMRKDEPKETQQERNARMSK